MVFEWLRSENRLCRILTYLLSFCLLVRPVYPGFVRHSTGGKEWKPKDRIPRFGNPVFEDTETRIVAFAGRDVLLPCRVKHLNDKVVSWIRTKDLHILTSGPILFTADDRFHPAQDLKSSDWSLRLKNSKTSDSGVYECQVNTDPKMNRKVTLDVVSSYEELSSNGLDLHMVDDEGELPDAGEAFTRVLGKEEQFVKIGNTIIFTCLVFVPNEPVSSVDWLKNQRQVSFQAARGGIIVETEKSDRKATSRLTIADVQPEDSGNYTCKPGNAKSHSVALVVVEAERTEAVQKNDGRRVKPEAELWSLLLIFISSRL